MLAVRADGVEAPVVRVEEVKAPAAMVKPTKKMFNAELAKAVALLPTEAVNHFVLV